MLKSKNETEDVFFMIKDCEAFFVQTQMKPQETLKFRLSKIKETFFFSPHDNLSTVYNAEKNFIGLTN